MLENDVEKLVEILAKGAMASGQPDIFFKNLINEANLHWKWMSETFEILEANPEATARSLIKWALQKGINTEKPELTTLGSILRPRLKNLGLQDVRFVIELMIRCDLYENKKVLIEDLINHPNLEKIFDERSIRLLTIYASNLLSHDSNPVSSDSITELIQILRRIDAFALVLEPFLSVSSDSEQARLTFSNEIEILNRDDISIFFKIFVLLKLLLEDAVHEYDRIQTVIKFSVQLQVRLQNEAPEIHDELESWLKIVNQKYGYESSQTTQPEVVGNLEAYLMIIIRPIKALRGKFCINSFLKTSHSFERWIDADVEIEKRSFDKNSCTLKEAESYVADLVVKSVEIARLEKTKFNCENFSLTIEFFLPYSLWSEKVDQWKIALLDEKIFIGGEFKVVLRSYERMAYVIGENQKEYALLPQRLEDKWRRIDRFLKEHPNKEDIREVFECLCQGNQLQDIHSLESRLGQNKLGKLGLKLACSPPRTKKERDGFFKIILKTGIPIAIWVRQEKIAGIRDLEEETNKFLQRKYLANLSLLLAQVREERKEVAYKKDGLGKHLAILCDDPKRLPSALPPLMTSTPLSLNG